MFTSNRRVNSLSAVLCGKRIGRPPIPEGSTGVGGYGTMEPPGGEGMEL